MYTYVYEIHTWHQTWGDVLCLTVSLLCLELEFIPPNCIQQQQTQDRQHLPLWCVGKGNIQNNLAKVCSEVGMSCFLDICIFRIGTYCLFLFLLRMYLS